MNKKIFYKKKKINNQIKYKSTIQPETLIMSDVCKQNIFF